MKRAWFAIAAFLALIILGAVTLSAQEDSSSLVIRPNAMRDGETKSFTDDGKRISIRRDGDAIKIEVEGADQTRRLTIVKTGEGEIRIEREGEVDGTRRFQVIGPGSRILIDGIPPPRERKSDLKENWFVCPEDGTMLRVPEGKEAATYKCPVDGRTMEKKKGRGFTIWWGEGSVESQRL